MVVFDILDLSLDFDEFWWILSFLTLLKWSSLAAIINTEWFSTEWKTKAKFSWFQMWPKAIWYRPALAINKFFGAVRFFLRVSSINSWFLFHFVDLSVILQINHWSQFITINSISIKKELRRRPSVDLFSLQSLCELFWSFSCSQIKWIIVYLTLGG